MEYRTLAARTTDRELFDLPPVVEPRTPPGTLEETLVTDTRASLTPAQMVERKLLSLLKSNPLPVSHRMSGPGTARNRVVS